MALTLGGAWATVVGAGLLLAIAGGWTGEEIRKEEKRD